MDFEELQQRIAKNIEALRARLAASHSSSIETLDDAQGRTGEFYVRQLGMPVAFENGRAEHIYNTHAASMRERMVGRHAAAREACFAQLLAAVPPAATVLNIGAGGDSALIRAVLSKTPSVLSMDFDDAVVALLRDRGFRAVAFDLARLSEVLHEPVDCVVGNSVLGYVDPTKLRVIVPQLAKSFRVGAVFTFDLSPHGKYFLLADGATEHTVANDSAVSPRVLLEFVRRLGVQTGIDSWGHYAWARATATEFAVLSAIAQLFELEGCIARLSQAPGGEGSPPVWVLRVAHDATSPFLSLSPLETAMDKTAVSSVLTNTAVFTPLVFIDRETGSQLARAFGLVSDSRRSAWEAAEYATSREDCRRLGPAEIQANISLLEIHQRVERVAAALRSGSLPSFRPLASVVAKDQTVHKQVLIGENPMSEDEADAYLDELYARARHQEQSNLARNQKREERRRKKDARKRR